MEMIVGLIACWLCLCLCLCLCVSVVSSGWCGLVGCAFDDRLLLRAVVACWL
jgi:hypothetical protein